MKILSFLFLLLVLPLQISAQVTQEWVSRYNGPTSSNDDAYSMAIDNEGNVYVIGFSQNGADFLFDYTTIKFNSSGVAQWSARYNGPGNSSDRVRSIAIDNEGNVYVTGTSAGVTGESDYATIKYNSSGVEQWVKRYNGPGDSYDDAYSIAIDNEGNVYVTGESWGGSEPQGDYATIKYNSSGVEQWVKRYNGPNSRYDGAFSLAVDGSGNLYVTGYSSGIGSFGDYATIKYNSSGVEQWVARYNGPGTGQDEANSIAIDNEGNVYVTGRSYGGTAIADDYATVKYNSSGVEQWSARYNGPGNNDDDVASLAVDGSGNVYVTGRSYNTLFNQDYATVKYNSSGVEQWSARYNGPATGTDEANSLAVDGSGNVYVTGVSNGGTGVWNDYATIKYNTLGVEQWVERYNGPNNVINSGDRANSIAIDNEGNVYVTGQSYGGTETLGDIVTIKYSQPPPLQFTKPTPYSKFIAGETDTIKWNDAGGWAAVNIKCKTNFGTPNESEIILAQGIPNLTFEFIWNIPETVLSFRTKIIIENANNTDEKIESDIFRIKPYVLTRLNPDSTYYEYRKNRDQFNVVNDSTQMWPFSFYQQFKYRTGIDPFTNMSYSDIQGDSTFSKAFFNTHPDWVSWVNTFSTNACYFSVQNGWYKPSSILKWKALTNVWGGSCFGIATANALAFVDTQGFRTKYPEFPDFINPINVGSDNAVRKIINELFTYQWGNPHLAHTLSNLNTRTPNQTLEDLKQMLKEDKCEIATLSIYNNNGPGGHNILPYGLKKDPTIDGLYDLQVYDNSNPNSNNPIQISTLGGNGFWGTPDWAGWGGNLGIILMDKAINYLPLPSLPKVFESSSPFILDDDVVEIFNNQGTEIIIKNSQQETIGFQDGEVIQNLNGGVPLIALNGSQTPPYGYSLPADNYEVMLSDFAEDTVKAFFFKGNKSFVYERSGAEQTQTDRLFFDGGVSVTNPDAQSKTIKLLNLLNENTQEKLAVVRTLELAQNDSVKIENPDSNKVKLISYGTAKNYDIELNYVTESEFGRFVDSDVSLPANTSHIFVPVWTDLTNSELRVLVDIGNDGTIDDTLSLINQVTGIGEDQGSLLTPDSYNLAQNFPNPFNPSTKISWQSPVGSHQTLKIYDVLGNEIATLVDEYREAGRYEITFDASDLSSGIYFYRLQAGSFVQTRKMILLK